MKLRTVVLGVALLGSSLGVERQSHADELSATEGAKLVAFFDKLIPAMVAAKDDCAKMATVIDTAVTANAALLRSVTKQLAAGTSLPKDVEAKLTDQLTKNQGALQKCLADPAVDAAMKRVENPDLPPAPSKADLADLKPPVAADLATYTKAIAGKGDLIATIATPSGAIRCKLLADTAPMTVANFVGLATGKKPWLDPKTNKIVRGKPFYDGLIFHRVIPGFMIQGGDPMGTGTGGPGYQFGDETHSDDKMTAGTLAMANAGPGTNGSQFFITEGAPDHLNGRHTIFGTCKPVELVQKIAKVPVGPSDKPKTNVTMKITIARGKL